MFWCNYFACKEQTLSVFFTCEAWMSRNFYTKSKRKLSASSQDWFWNFQGWRVWNWNQSQQWTSGVSAFLLEVCSSNAENVHKVRFSHVKYTRPCACVCRGVWINSRLHLNFEGPLFQVQAVRKFGSAVSSPLNGGIIENYMNGGMVRESRLMIFWLFTVLFYIKKSIEFEFRIKFEHQAKLTELSQCFKKN